MPWWLSAGSVEVADVLPGFPDDLGAVRRQSQPGVLGLGRTRSAAPGPK